MPHANSSNSHVVGRTSKSKSNKKGNIMNSATRAITSTIAALIIALLFTLPAAAAPRMDPIIPPELTPLGEPQTWETGANMQNSHWLELKDIVAMDGAVYATVKVTWVPDKNNGKNNETSLVKTSIGDFVCKDADFTDPNNKEYVCIFEGGEFSGSAFQLTILYAGPGGWGDSHGLKVEVQFYGLREGHTTITTTSTGGNHPHLTFDRKTKTIVPSDTTTPNTDTPRPASLPNTGDETSILPTLLVIGAILLILAGLGVRKFGKIAS